MWTFCCYMHYKLTLHYTVSILKTNMLEFHPHITYHLYFNNHRQCLLHIVLHRLQASNFCRSLNLRKLDQYLCPWPSLPPKSYQGRIKKKKRIASKSLVTFHLKRTGEKMRSNEPADSCGFSGTEAFISAPVVLHCVTLNPNFCQVISLQTFLFLDFIPQLISPLLEVWHPV